MTIELGLRWHRKSYAAVIVLLVAAVSMIWAFAYSRLDAAAPPTPLENATGLIAVNGSGFPNVVAYVDGNPISGKTLAERIYAIQRSQNPSANKTNAESEALQQAIQDQVLLDHAGDFGVMVSIDEAKAYAKEQQSLAQNDATAKQELLLSAKQFGADASAFASQPQVIQAYRDLLTIGKMQNYVRNLTPENQRDTAAKWQAALQKFTDGIHANVQVLISVQ